MTTPFRFTARWLAPVRMKRITAPASLVAAFIASAPVAAADPASGEAFWARIHDVYHIPISHDDAMAEGPAVCTYLDQPGTDFEQAGLQVLQMHPDWTVDQASEFAGAATGAWYPQNGPEGAPGG